MDFIMLLATRDFEINSQQGRNFHLGKKPSIKSDQILFLFHLLVSRKTQKEGQQALECLSLNSNLKKHILMVMKTVKRTLSAMALQDVHKKWMNSCCFKNMEFYKPCHCVLSEKASDENYSMPLKVSICWKCFLLS